MALRIFIKQQIIVGKQVFPNQEIHYAGTNPQNLTVTSGKLPANRQWDNYGQFLEATEWVSDLHKLELIWSIDRDNFGNQIAGAFTPQKSVSGALAFTQEGYRLIRSWLIDDVSASLNSIEVQIEDTTCGRYLDYSINSNDLTWCEDGNCQFDVGLRQKDLDYQCIQRTLIADNWQGWFQKVPAGGKKHPRFSYCNEPPSDTMMLVLWYILTTTLSIFSLFIIPIVLVMNPLIFIVKGICDFLDNNFGTNIDYKQKPLELDTIFDGMSTVYIESSGCGREHPAPLIRDYINNVCGKCGVRVDEESAPIFFNPDINIQSSRGLVNTKNHYYNATYLSASTKRGIRRFNKMNLYQGFADPSNEFWIPENEPLLTLDMFLDEISTLFNTTWKINGGKLFIQRKDYFIDGSYQYDFTNVDRDKILQGVCFTPTGNKYPAYWTGLYVPDPSDKSGNEAGNANGSGQMNGIVSFGNIDTNPNFEGIDEKTTVFGATKFRGDGSSNDYIYDAIQSVMNGSGLNPLSAVGTTYAILKAVTERIDDFSKYALLLGGETSVQPKVICWDGASYENAKAIITKYPKELNLNFPVPEVNPKYNKNYEQFRHRHVPEYKVRGQKLTFNNYPELAYNCTDTLGNTIGLMYVAYPNYPMYSEPFYYETLYDYFHWIDDPRNNPRLNMRWNVKIQLCCEDLIKCGVLGTAQDVILGQKVKLPTGYFQDGVIKEIKVNYQTSDEYGQHIELSGEI